MENRVRIALYARISKDKSSQDTENQLVDLRDFVARKRSDGWELAGEYVDRFSGRTADRPAFKRLFEDAAKRKFDLILFWSLDRFSREGVLETLQHLQRLNSYGVEWWSFREEYLRSVGVFKEAALAILAAVQNRKGSGSVSVFTRGCVGRERKVSGLAGRKWWCGAEEWPSCENGGSVFGRLSVRQGSAMARWHGH